MITKDEIIKHWQIQEHLLQGYRLIFLLSQTILITVASLLTTVNSADLISHIVFCLLLLPGLVLLSFWRRIAMARGLDVSYLQSLLFNYGKIQNHDSLMQEFKAWQKFNKPDKVKFLKENSIEPSQTRTIMETKIPALYLFVWMGLVLINIYQAIVVIR